MKMHLGNLPDKSKPVGRYGDFILWHRETRDQPPWMSLKLVATKPMRKANYWLGWNVDEHRFGRNVDHKTLLEPHPHTAAAITNRLLSQNLEQNDERRS